MDKLTMQAYKFFLNLVYDRGVDFSDAQYKVSAKYPSVDFSDVQDLYDNSMVKYLIASDWSI